MLPPLTRTDARTWPGMASDPDPHDLVAGQMQYQENIDCTAPGKLTGRRGYRLVEFSQGSETPGAPVISMYTFSTGVGEWICYHDNSGKIRAGLL